MRLRLAFAGSFALAVGCADDTTGEGGNDESSSSSSSGGSPTTNAESESSGSSSTAESSTAADTTTSTAGSETTATETTDASSSSSSAADESSSSAAAESSSSAAESSSSDSGGAVKCDEDPCATLDAIEDAQVVSSDQADANFGSDQYTPYGVGQQNDMTGNQIGRALYKFDVGALPDGVVIDTAFVVLREFDNYSGYPIDMTLYPTDSEWNEDLVTWNDQPTVSAVALDSSNVGCCGEVHPFAVAAAVQAALDAGEEELSFELRATNEDVVGGVRWFFREGEGVDINGIVGQRPTLAVDYHAP